jgi:ribosomal protein S27AE
MRRFLGKLPDPIIRLLVLVIIAVAGLAAAYSKIPPEYKDPAFQIAAATTREKAKSTHYAGALACIACHAEENELKHSGYHRDISCETCHGPGQAHAENPVDVKPTAPRDRRFCPTCHAYDPARPMGFPQINPITHNPVQPCIACHNPHDPKPKRVPGACSACHAEIENMKAISPHALLECTTCHVTPDEHKVTPRVVKAAKPSDREFCGKCHSTASKVEGPPKIDLDSHEPKYICWQCHYPHMPEVK